jgi:hypothetical protein
MLYLLLTTSVGLWERVALIQLHFLAMKITFTTLLTYNALFGETPFDVIAAAKSLPLVVCVNYITWSTAKVSLDEFDSRKQSQLLGAWITDFPTKESKEFVSLPLRRLAFINKPISLMVIELLLEHADRESKAEQLTSEQLLTLFKLYIHTSMTFTNNQNKIAAEEINATTLKDIDSYIKALLPLRLPYFDLSITSAIQNEIYKATVFFKYCEAIPEQAEYLKKYLSSFGFSSWHDYLAKLLLIYFHLYKEVGNNEIKSSITIDSTNPVNTAMIRALESQKLDLSTFTPDKDFKALRAYPVLKTDNNTYTLLSNDLFLNKFFQVIQFDFGNFISKNGGEAHGRKVRSFLDYKSVYSSFFSEETLLYNLLKYITAGKKKYKSFTGVQIKTIIGEDKTEPDYYIRDGNNIFLFEAKDAIFSTKAKLSYSFDALKEEVSKKMIKNDKGKQKGVTQLSLVIKAIINNDYSEIDKGIPSSYNIYPVLLITDSAFTAFGINHILDKELRMLVTGIPKYARIHPLSLIRIDTLIEFRESFKDETIPLKKAIAGYTSKLQDKGNFLNPAQSFDDFMRRKYGNIQKPLWGDIESDISAVLAHT